MSDPVGPLPLWFDRDGLRTLGDWRYFSAENSESDIDWLDERHCEAVEACDSLCFTVFPFLRGSRNP